MTEPVDLGGRLQRAIDGAYARGFPMSIAYVDEAGKPSISLRGSIMVLSRTQIGLWSRKADSGLALAIASRPDVALLFFGDLPDGTRLRAAIGGRARVDRTRSREVYDKMGDVEQRYDPDARGVAVIIDVDSVEGMTVDGPFKQG